MGDGGSRDHGAELLANGRQRLPRSHASLGGVDDRLDRTLLDGTGDEPGLYAFQRDACVEVTLPGLFRLSGHDLVAALLVRYVRKRYAVQVHKGGELGS